MALLINDKRDIREEYAFDAMACPRLRITNLQCHVTVILPAAMIRVRKKLISPRKVCV